MNLFAWEGRLDRGRYLAWGAGLFGLKFALDTAFSFFFFHRSWSLFNYLHLYRPVEPAVGPAYLIGLAALSLPFIYVGVALTFRRLRDCGLPLWLTLFFFIPLLNLLFFVFLSVLGPKPDPRFPARPFLQSPAAAALGSLLITAALALGAVVLVTSKLQSYGFGLFVALPFCQGMCASLLYGYSRPGQDFGRSAAAACLSILFTGVAVAVWKIEGLICMAMAAPIALGLALLGALVGHLVQKKQWHSTPAMVLTILAAAPALLGMDGARASPAPVWPVTTAIDIQAPPSTVWNNVVSFSELPPPKEWIFKTGIAYPTRAVIEGQGVGAVRRCQFTTGEFVEPITVWDPPRRLRFAVTEVPPPMRELNPFGEVHPPHMNGYMVSKEGEFRLSALPGGGTRLEGTTWYQHGLWPALYWKLWSDAILHRVHSRVLNHIKTLSEADIR